METVSILPFAEGTIWKIIPSDSFLGCACAFSYSSIRLPGDPSCEELSRLLLNPALDERPRWVPLELTEAASVSSRTDSDRLGLSARRKPPEASCKMSGSPYWEGGEGNCGWSTEVAFWEDSEGADCIK